MDLEVIRVTIWSSVLKVSGCFSPPLQSFFPWDTEPPSLPLEPVRSVLGGGGGGRAIACLSEQFNQTLADAASCADSVAVRH